MSAWALRDEPLPCPQVAAATERHRKAAWRVDPGLEARVGNSRIDSPVVPDVPHLRGLLGSPSLPHRQAELSVDRG